MWKFKVLSISIDNVKNTIRKQANVKEKIGMKNGNMWKYDEIFSEEKQVGSLLIRFKNSCFDENADIYSIFISIVLKICLWYILFNF